MLEPLPPDKIEELLAGYALGNLDSEELEQLENLLLQHPELLEQREELCSVLELIPYGLDPIKPPKHLGEKIFHSAREQAQSNNNILPRKNKFTFGSPKFSFPFAISGGLAILTVFLGLNNYQLRTNLNLANNQLHQNQVELAQKNSLISNYLNISQEVVVANNWSGLFDLVVDHQKFINYPGKTVDFSSNEAKKIANHFQPEFQSAFKVPELKAEDAKLLGGSLCNLAKTKAIRYTYKFSSGETVSFYQLERPEKFLFPHVGKGKVKINQPQQPVIVMWEDDNFIYALVAESQGIKLDKIASQLRI